MPVGFKDLSDLHIASVECAQPEVFHKVLEAAMWRADREHDLSSSSSNSLGVDGDDHHRTPLGMAVMMKQMEVVEILHHHLNPLAKAVVMKKNLRRRPGSPRAPKKRKSSEPS
jgi:hypothetical protein